MSVSMDRWAAQPSPNEITSALTPVDTPVRAADEEQHTEYNLRITYMWSAELVFAEYPKSPAAEVARVVCRSTWLSRSYMSREEVPSSKLQLLAVATTSLAVLLEMDAIWYNTLDRWSYLTDDTFTAIQVGDMQQKVLNTLDFDVLQPTAHTFLDAALARNAGALPDGLADVAAAVLFVSQAYAPGLCEEWPPSLVAEGAMVAAAAHVVDRLNVSGMRLVNPEGEVRFAARRMLRGQAAFQADDEVPPDLRAFRRHLRFGKKDTQRHRLALGEGQRPVAREQAAARPRMPSGLRDAFIRAARAPGGLRLLGRGSFGRVYEMPVGSSGRRAVKVMRDADPGLGVALSHVKELAALRLLGAHRSVARLFRAEISHAFRVYAELELVLPGDLCSWLARHQEAAAAQSGTDLPPKVQERIALGVLEGVAYIHSRSLMHCDIKDLNVLCSEDLSRIKLADFGASLLCDNQHAQTRTGKGTIDHMAPEVLLHADADQPCNYSFSADMWAVGVILLQVAHGPILRRLGWSANNDMERMASAVASVLGPPAPDAFDPSIAAGLRLELLVPQPGLNAPVRPTGGPPRMEGLITKLLDYSPAVRPSAAACYAELTGAELDQPAPNTLLGCRALWKPSSSRA